jgi:hypothetical protein
MLTCQQTLDDVAELVEALARCLWRAGKTPTATEA